MTKKPKLPKRFKNKWINALRSGKYKQGQSDLYNENKDTFCCLGVAGFICGGNLDRLDCGGYLEKNITVSESVYNNIPNILRGDNPTSIKLANFVLISESIIQYNYLVKIKKL